ncbi:hypothetical protein XM25_20375 [Devosia sp. H5989]|nr:hypothetical protein XM25_20375 [Devosia sp. H5989]
MTTIIDEMVAAARGCALLLIGNRTASQYFDFSQRGLVGSFIAILVATTFSAYLPALLGQEPSVSVLRVILTSAIAFGLQLGFAALALRQMKRLDGFVPYLVAENWATFFLSLITLVLALFGLGGDVFLVVVGLVMLVIQINIARLIVTLAPLQVAIFLIAQLVAGSIGLLIVGLSMPLPADAGTLVSALG